MKVSIATELVHEFLLVQKVCGFDVPAEYVQINRKPIYPCRVYRKMPTR
jgi:hypothetical protein